MLGAYGRTLAVSGSPMPIDGFHGADADTLAGVTPFGVRHTVKDLGPCTAASPLVGETEGDGSACVGTWLGQLWLEADWRRPRPASSG